MSGWPTLDGTAPKIIAHRGASGYRPEHTLHAYALAAEQGADAIEPDVVASRDGVLFARHDLGLSRSTDVASRAAFASRARELGGHRDWWIGDFSSAEIGLLRAIQPFGARGTQFDGRFTVPRLGQILDFAADVSRQRGAPFVVDVELKHPDYFAAAGIDLLGGLHADLSARGLTGGQAPVWLESFDHAFLRRAHDRCGNACFALFETLPPGAADVRASLRELGAWTRGIAVAKSLLWDGSGRDSGLVAEAHALGLQVHAWTFRDDRAPVPFDSVRAELFAAFSLGVDALFCDFPDTAVAARAAFRDEAFAVA